jgi:hypothetical protein
VDGTTVGAASSTTVTTKKGKTLVLSADGDASGVSFTQTSGSSSGSISGSP